MWGVDRHAQGGGCSEVAGGERCGVVIDWRRDVAGRERRGVVIDECVDMGSTRWLVGEVWYGDR